MKTVFLSLLATLLLLTSCGTPIPESPTLESQATWSLIGPTKHYGQRTALAYNPITGKRVLAYASRDNKIKVLQQTKFSWELIGDIALVDPTHNHALPKIAVDSKGRIILAYKDNSTIKVKRFSGSFWVSLNSAELETYHSGLTWHSVQLVLDRNDNPIVALGTLGDYFIGIYRFNGTNWIAIEDRLVDARLYSRNYAPALAVDSSNQLVVSWQSYSFESDTININTQRWNGSSWSDLGTVFSVKSTFFRSHSLALNSKGHPVLAITRKLAGYGDQLLVYRWSTSGWRQLGTSSLNIRSSSSASDPVIALDHLNRSVVVWKEMDGTNGSLFVKRWDGLNWVLLSDVPLDVSRSNNVIDPALNISSTNITVSWAEGVSNLWEDFPNFTIYAKQTVY